MFTGIIESTARVIEIERENSNLNFRFESSISHELKVDQSVSHDGVCLTVTRVSGNQHWVTAVDETLQKTNFNQLRVGDVVNLERSMLSNGRFDGHIVQGHVDQVGTCVSIKDASGSWVFGFEYDPAPGNITIEKGSVAVNGVSLTCFNSGRGIFSVAIIPFTFEHTGFGSLKTGQKVNLEFDVVGKYIQRMVSGRPLIDPLATSA